MDGRHWTHIKGISLLGGGGGSELAVPRKKKVLVGLPTCRRRATKNALQLVLWPSSGGGRMRGGARSREKSILQITSAGSSLHGADEKGVERSDGGNLGSHGRRDSPLGGGTLDELRPWDGRGDSIEKKEYPPKARIRLNWRLGLSTRRAQRPRSSRAEVLSSKMRELCNTAGNHIFSIKRDWRRRELERGIGGSERLTQIPLISAARKLSDKVTWGGRLQKRERRMH